MSSFLRVFKVVGASSFVAGRERCRALIITHIDQPYVERLIFIQLFRGCDKRVLHLFFGRLGCAVIEPLHSV